MLCDGNGNTYYYTLIQFHIGINDHYYSGIGMHKHTLQPDYEENWLEEKDLLLRT